MESSYNNQHPRPRISNSNSNSNSNQQQSENDVGVGVDDKSSLLPLLRRNSSMTTATAATTTTSSEYNNNDSSPIPTNVCTEEQLITLPKECLTVSTDPKILHERPIQHVHEDGRTITTYALRPMIYSVIIILITEGIERFAFYGINYTQTSYLTGEYNIKNDSSSSTVDNSSNNDWDANMDAISASQYVSISVAVAYTTPFIGAYFADQLFGDYYTIIIGIFCLYIPGLICITLTTIPNRITGIDHFNHTALRLGLLVLWPMGTGIVKSVVNVFGAKQFHPLLQSSLIESYYVNFYMCINIGALIGGIIVPLLAQQNVTIAYSLPLLLLCIGMTCFIVYSPRFICTKPKRHPITERIVHYICCQCCCFCSRNKKSKSKRKLMKHQTNLLLQHASSSTSPSDPIPISAILRISLLVVPFNIVYSQMSTTFIVQGTVMKKSLYGLIDAACMNNADAIAVLFFGHYIGTILYPYLSNQNIKIPTTYKFAIGSAFGAFSIMWSLLIEYWIQTTYHNTGNRISILCQAISYILIGAGEIFAVSAAYEVAFKASPPDQKVLFSAVNLFCIGGLPSVVCIVLYQICIPWFTASSTGTTNISHIHDYTTAHIDKYFWLLLILSLFGTFINLLPWVRDYVESIEDRATDMIRTPKTPKFPPSAALRRQYDSIGQQQQGDGGVDDDDEDDDLESYEQQLLASKRHQYYLKYGSGPSLYKHGSMRAGQALSFTNRNDYATATSNKSINYSLQDGTTGGGSTNNVQQKSTRPTLNSKTLSKLYTSAPNRIMHTNTSSGIATNNMTRILSSADGQPITMANASLLSPSTKSLKKTNQFVATPT